MMNYKNIKTSNYGDFYGGYFGVNSGDLLVQQLQLFSCFRLGTHYWFWVWIWILLVVLQLQ